MKNKKRLMFLKMVTSSLVRRRSRMLVALLAIMVGATILSGLVMIYYDVPRQMSAQFRSYGANVIFTPAESGFITDEDVEKGISYIPSNALEGYTAYRYENSKINNVPVTIAGVDVKSALKTSPYWHINGAVPEKEGEIMLGTKVASAFDVRIGDEVTFTNAYDVTEEVKEYVLTAYENALNDGEKTLEELDENGYLNFFAKMYKQKISTLGAESAAEKIVAVAEELRIDLAEGKSGKSYAKLKIIPVTELTIMPGTGEIACDHELTVKTVGLLETGGSEEEYVYMSHKDVTYLALQERGYDVAEVSVSATADVLNRYISNINGNVSGVTAKPVKRVTASESSVLTKLKSLVFIVTAVVLVLTMICVATTMTAVIAERRKEIALRKCLGATSGSIVGEFMSEGLLLGGVGGIVGSVLGYVFADVVSLNVFSSSITFLWWLIPVTIVASVAVTGLACLIPIRSAIDVDPALVLKGE